MPAVSILSLCRLVGAGSSFVREVCTSRGATVTLRAIASLGAALDMSVTAQGVEHAEQLAALRELGCDPVQG